MAEIRVRTLREDDWQAYRAIRLAALADAPDAFVARHAEESALDEAMWRARMVRSPRLLAEVDGAAVGVVSLGQDEDDERVAQLFGLWVTPPARGTGVATALVQAGADAALAGGRTQLSYWVGTDNGRAVAFASGFGFRPGNRRRPMHGHEGEQEIVMVLALGHDRGQPTAR
ncbi:MAG: GNAT family N-acetyltransferase [Kineosporiaceae bacterium]|nr:GNAT family N-acetyltransferase [Kineosporiaceae bacterium]